GLAPTGAAPPCGGHGVAQPRGGTRHTAALFGGGIANAFSLHLEDLIRAVIKHAAVKQDQGAGAGLVVNPAAGTGGVFADGDVSPRARGAWFVVGVAAARCGGGVDCGSGG